MKEIGVPFRGPLALANIEGRKTQTRRLVSSPKWSLLDGGPVVKKVWAGLQWDKARTEAGPGDPLFLVPDADGKWHVITPRYLVGDRIWQRETVGFCAEENRYVYAADDPLFAGNFKPSIQMPRRASRFVGEITEVRGVFPRDISREDAIAEGCPEQEWYRVEGGPEKWFKTLLCDIHGDPGVLDMPMWAITYRRVEG